MDSVPRCVGRSVGRFEDRAVHRERNPTRLTMWITEASEPGSIGTVRDVDTIDEAVRFEDHRAIVNAIGNIDDTDHRGESAATDLDSARGRHN